MASQKQASRTGKSRPGNAKPARSAQPAKAAKPADREPAAIRSGLMGYLATHKLEVSTLFFSLAGLGVSIYMVIEHYTQNSYALCPSNSTFNCGKVTTSPESVIIGIPVAVLGLAFYLFMVGINSPWGWRSKLPAVHWARLASIVVGIVFVLYLVYAELFLINAICIYCTSVHIITFTLFALIIIKATLSGVQPSPDRR